MCLISPKKNLFIPGNTRISSKYRGEREYILLPSSSSLSHQKKHKKIRAFLHYVEGKNPESERRFPHICIIVLYFLLTLWTEEQRREAVKYEKIRRKKKKTAFFATNSTAFVVEKWKFAFHSRPRNRVEKMYRNTQFEADFFCLVFLGNRRRHVTPWKMGGPEKKRVGIIFVLLPSSPGFPYYVHVRNCTVQFPWHGMPRGGLMTRAQSFRISVKKYLNCKRTTRYPK